MKLTAGDETLKWTARQLVTTVRNNMTRAGQPVRRVVRRVLRKSGYPPDKQEEATITVLEQAEVLSEAWAA